MRELAHYRKEANYYYVNVETDKITPCQACPICGRPAVKRTVDSGIFASNPMFVFMHEFLVSVKGTPVVCIGLKACQVR